jgi:membrane protease YdiL (CAAX protease family)
LVCAQRPALRAIGLTALVFIATGLFDGYWQSKLGLKPVMSPFSGIAAKSTAIIVLTGITAVVTPVIEEVFFRGLLYRCFRNRFSVLPSSVAVGVMFGLVHMEYPLAVLPEVAVAGVLLCLLYEHTGSLWPGITFTLYLDAGGFEQALTGRYPIVIWSLALLVLVLVVRGLLGRGGGKLPPPSSAFAT